MSKSRGPYKKSMEEILATYQNMCAFDWDLKEINNLKHTPGKSPLLCPLSTVLCTACRQGADSVRVLVLGQLAVLSV